MTVEDKLQLLGIQEVTTDRQQKNGTRVFKLPIKDYEISLENFIDLKDKINFGKYQIFDYRINNQIILK